MRPVFHRNGEVSVDGLVVGQIQPKAEGWEVKSGSIAVWARRKGELEDEALTAWRVLNLERQRRQYQKEVQARDAEKKERVAQLRLERRIAKAQQKR